ncbi:MAG: hypothetical protein FWC70_08830 [Defluviitaleaceae bacterium]|nr:hypothetical protein [Defluviitaleaceae bacterium]
MINQATFDAVCGNAKLRLGDDDLQAVNAFMDEIVSGIDAIEIDAIEIDGNIDVRDIMHGTVTRPGFESMCCARELYAVSSSLREDVPRPSLSRAEVLSGAAHTQAGCVSIPLNIRDEG